MFGRCWKEQNLSTSTNQLCVLQGERAIWLYILYIYVITKAITGLCKETASCWHSFRLCNGSWTWSCSHPVCRFKKRNVRNVAPLFNALNPIPLLLTGGRLRNWISWDFHISQVHRARAISWCDSASLPWLTSGFSLYLRVIASWHHAFTNFTVSHGKETVICW